jgi:hypothetical protein
VFGASGAGGSNASDATQLGWVPGSRGPKNYEKTQQKSPES